MRKTIYSCDLCKTELKSGFDLIDVKINRPNSDVDDSFEICNNCRIDILAFIKSKNVKER